MGAPPRIWKCAALAPSSADTAVAAPVTATPAMNLRRLTFGPFVLAKSLRGMSSSIWCPVGRARDAIDPFAAKGN
jgi:hypothetical protein